jgi:predicted anti-sigma-YlaC factor YlaD
MDNPIHSPHCGNLLGNLSDFIDGDLAPELCVQIEEHLKGCENCRVVVNTIKKTVEIYEDCSSQAILPSDVKERLFAKLDLKDFYK